MLNKILLSNKQTYGDRDRIFSLEKEGMKLSLETLKMVLENDKSTKELLGKNEDEELSLEDVKKLMFMDYVTQSQYDIAYVKASWIIKLKTDKDLIEDLNDSIERIEEAKLISRTYTSTEKMDNDLMGFISRNVDYYSFLVNIDPSQDIIKEFFDGCVKFSIPNAEVNVYTDYKELEDGQWKLDIIKSTYFYKLYRF